jgi:predicted O-methyltransferase YrrM
LRKYFVLENYLRRLEVLLYGWGYDVERSRREERLKFERAGLDYDRGLVKLDKLISELGRPVESEDRSMRSIHWVLFACLSERSPKPIRRILEIGTYDGETAFLISKLFPEAEIVTVDLPEDDPIFKGSYVRDDPGALAVFKERRNAHLRPANIHYLEINSFFLPGKVNGEFDLIWVDGGHLYPEAAWDVCNAYHLCAPGGIMMVDDVIIHERGFRDTYVSPDSHHVLEYVASRTGEPAAYFLKRNAAKWSAVPRRRKFVALLRKSFVTSA